MELEGGEKKPKKHKSKSRDKPTNKKSFRAKRPPSEAKVEDLDQFDLENPLSDDDIRETRRDKKRKSEKPVQEEVSKSKKKDKKKDKKKKAKKERPEVPQPMAKMPKKRKNSLDQALLQEMLKVSLQQAKKKEKHINKQDKKPITDEIVKFAEQLFVLTESSSDDGRPKPQGETPGGYK